MEQKSCKRPWRKLVKKLQRKRKRQKLARQRDKELEEAQLEKLKDPFYKSWLEQHEAIERQKEETEGHQRKEQEELWLRRELLAQKQFKIDEIKRQAEEAKLAAERLKQQEKLKLLEEEREKKREEIKLQAEKASKEFDNIMINMQEYLDDCTMKTPPRLDCNFQSRPGEKSCDFFDKTNCCRFGLGCTFNHIRPMLAKIILIKHFFQHPLLEQQEHDEYSRSDSDLELNERDLRDSYDEFCEDVWPVLQEFGSIINFRVARNVQAHLRGHAFVEYADKRSALKAFIKLQNRYYASKRLSVEFSNLQQWRTGVCGMRSDFLKGMSLDRKCPKGAKCNFLHLMKNKDDMYNIPIPRSASNSTRTPRKSPIISWNSGDTQRNKSLQSRNWRWSESPEIELKIKNNEEKFKVKRGVENKHIVNSSERKSPMRSTSNSPNCFKNIIQTRSKSPNSYRYNNDINSTFKSPSSSYLVQSSQRKFRRRSRSNSPNLCYKNRKQISSAHDTNSSKSTFKSPSSHRTSKTKYSVSEKQKDSKSNRKSEHKSKKSKKSKSHRKSRSPNLHSHKDTKRTRSRS